MRMTPKVASSCLAAFIFVSCTINEHKQDTVTVYVSADEQIAREVFTAFTKKTGIEVAWVGDSEASKTTALVQRLFREQDRPIADVFWSSEILGTIRLADSGLLSPCKTNITMEWPEQHRDRKFRWFGFSPRARVIAYNPSVISESELPRTWWEYGEAAIADPRFGTTSTHIAVMADFPEQSKSLFESMEGKPMLGGNAATVQAVIDGTVLFAMTDSDDVHAAIERGKSIAMFMPRHHDDIGGGTLLIPNTVGIVRGCQQPEYATQFVEFLLSNEVAIMLALSSSHNIPIQQSVASQFPELMVEDPLVVDFYRATSAYENQLAAVMDELSQ